MASVSQAQRVAYECPDCGDELTEDTKHRGFVRHKGPHVPGRVTVRCTWGHRQRDPVAT